MNVVTAYKYDKANRLAVAVEQPLNAADPVCGVGNLAANGWCHQYGYDRWGKRRIAGRVNDGQWVAEPGSFSPANNRIADSNWQYEARGAVTKDAAGRSYSYDGESRMVATCRYPDNLISESTGNGEQDYLKRNCNAPPTMTMKHIRVRCWKDTAQCSDGSRQTVYFTIADFGDARRLFVCPTCGQLFAVDPDEEFHTKRRFEDVKWESSCPVCGSNLGQALPYPNYFRCAATGQIDRFERVGRTIPPDEDSLVVECWNPLPR